VLGIIREPVGTLPKEPNHHRHETIAVLGGRGLGKTSFVLSLLARAKDELKGDIALLDILDPSLIERNEIFLATVTSAIVQKLDEHNKQTYGDPEQKKLIPAYEALDAIARAFPVLSPRGKDLWPKPDGDPMDFAERMLRGASSGRKLSESFARFTNAAADALGVKAFILPLDDVDTAFEQGWLVLETLRKYLATPRLITVLSGDLNLYQMLVLRHNYDQLQSLVKAEEVFAGQEERATALSRYKDQAQNLRDQYLTKVLPPHRRIHLRWLRDQLSAGRGTAPIRIVLEDKDESSENSIKDVPLEEIIGYVARDLFGWPLPLLDQYPKEGAIPLMSAGHNPAVRILPSNTRNFLRLLKALWPWYVQYKKTAQGEGAQDPDLEGLYQTLANALYEAEIEIENLNALATGGGRNWLAQRVWSQSVQEANAFLLSGPLRRGSEEVEQAFLLVQGSFYRGCRKAKDVSACLDYGIRVAAPALAIGRLHGEDPRNAQYKALAYRTQLGREIPTVDVAGHLRAVTWRWPSSWNAGYMYVLNRRHKRRPHVAIRGFAESQAQDKSIDFGVYHWWKALGDWWMAPDQQGNPRKENQEYFTKEQDILPSLERFWYRADDVSCQILMLYFMTLRDELGEEFSFIDLYQGLGNLVGLLHEVGRATGTVEDSVQVFLERNSSKIRSYAINLAGTEQLYRRDSGGGTDEREVPPFQPSEPLEQALTHWAEAARSLVDMDRPPHSPPFFIPAPQIGSVFEVLEKQMERISADVVETGWSVGAMLERWTVAFWQNLLLVELEYRLGTEFVATGRIVRNVLKTIEEFKTKLDILEELIAAWQPNELWWRVPRNALLWMSCPVLLACCRVKLRLQILGLVTRVEEKLSSVGGNFFLNRDNGDWARQLRKGMEKCEEFFPKRVWHFDDDDDGPVVGRKFDIHDLWCSLFVAPWDTPGPVEEDYEAFEKEMGLTLR
jgi:hypothetical protein